MMSTIHIHITLCIIIFSIYVRYANSSSVLRIRLADGQTIRFNFEEEKDTIKTCYDRLVSMGKISSSAKINILGNLYDKSNANVPMRTLKLANGTMINIVDTSPVQEQQKSEVDTSTKSDTKKNNKKEKSSSKKKKVITSTDYSLQRQNMEKIIPQKASTLHIVSISQSMERIFTRLSKGGIGLLLGTNTQLNTGSSKKKRSSSKLKPGKSILPTSIDTTTSATSSQNESKNITSVYAVYELFTYDDNNNNNNNNNEDNSNNTPINIIQKLSQYTTMCQDVKMLANKMGLDIVGCCINMDPYYFSADNTPNNLKKQSKKVILNNGKVLKDDTTDKKKKKDSADTPIMETWSAHHVYITSYLREFFELTSDDPFITLSVSKMRNTPNEDESSTKSKDKKSKSTPELSSIYQQDGLSIEAYKLSDQASRLIDKKILSSDVYTTLYTKWMKSKALNTKVSSKNMMDKITSEDENPDLVVELLHDVLIIRKETKKVDASLLTVPIAIQPLSTTTTSTSTSTSLESSSSTKKSDKKGKGTSVTDADNTELNTQHQKYNFIHFFPTVQEIEASKETSNLVTSLVKQLIPKLSTGFSTSMKLKFKDIHFLYHLYHKIDKSIVYDIMTVMLDDTKMKLSAKSMMMIQMLKSTLFALPNTKHLNRDDDVDDDDDDEDL